jgi:hypothetical protein
LNAAVDQAGVAPPLPEKVVWALQHLLRADNMPREKRIEIEGKDCQMTSCNKRNHCLHGLLLDTWPCRRTAMPHPDLFHLLENAYPDTSR